MLPSVTPPGKTSAVFDEAKMIPWDRQSALRFEGGHVIEDRKGTNGEALPRTVAFEVLFNTGPDVAAGSKLLFALTYDPSPQAVAACTDALGTFAEADLAANLTDEWASVKLSPTQPAPEARTRWRARASAALGAQVLVTPLYLWVGWRFVGTSDTDCLIQSVSIFETRS